MKDIEKILADNGYNDVRWISGKHVIVQQWVRMKCLFGCPNYGKRGTCPPSVPEIKECRELFSEYEKIAVIHIRDNVDNIPDHRAWSRDQNRKLRELERQVFIAGYPKVLVLYVDGNCVCDECAGNREDCTDKAAARPSPESLGVDVFSTVRNCGFKIDVLGGKSGEMDRFAFLMVL